MDALDLDQLGIEPVHDEIDPREELYCAVCKKPFRSKNQWLNHEKSKKHVEAVEKARSELLMEGEELDPLVSRSATPPAASEEDSPDYDSEEEPLDGLTDELLDELIADEIAQMGDTEQSSPNDLVEEPSNEEEDAEDNACPGEEATSPDIPPSSQDEEEEEEEEEEVLLTSYRSRKKQKKQKKKQKALNAFGKSRQPPPQSLDEQDEDSVPQPTPTVDSSEPIDQEQEQDEAPPKNTKKKGRRAKNRQKGQQITNGQPAPEAVPLDARHVCVTCKSNFPSRNKLFAHVKKTGHAKPL